MRTGFWSWMVAAGVTLSPALAVAQEVKQIPECTREPTDADVAAAKAAFQAGNASFNEADYPRAILYWEDAYRRDCTAHALLLNLARAYELSNQKRQAVVALQAFLARQPDTAQKEQILRRIEVLNKQIDQQQQQQQQQRQAAAAPAPTTAQPPAAATPAPDAQLQAETAPPVDAGAGSRSAVPLFVAGGGAALAIAGGILFFVSANKVDGYENDPPPDGCGGDRENCPKEIVDRANGAVTRQNIGGAIGLIGLGALAGGLVWYFVQEPTPPTAARPSKRKAARLAVDPQLGRGFAGLALGGSF